MNRITPPPFAAYGTRPSYPMSGLRPSFYTLSHFAVHADRRHACIFSMRTKADELGRETTWPLTCAVH